MDHPIGLACSSSLNVEIERCVCACIATPPPPPASQLPPPSIHSERFPQPKGRTADTHEQQRLGGGRVWGVCAEAN